MSTTTACVSASNGLGVVIQIITGANIFIRVDPSKDATFTKSKERNLFFSDACSPRKSDPGHWQSKLYLRDLVFGKQVKYKIDQVLSKAGVSQHFGTLFVYDDATQMYLSVTELMVEAGWLLPRSTETNHPGCRTSVVAAAERAKAKKLGLHNPNMKNYVISSIHDKKTATQFLSHNRHRPLRAIVDHVSAGNAMTVVLLPNDESSSPKTVHLPSVVIQLADIRCAHFLCATPTPLSSTGFAARAFTESRLLYREIIVNLIAVADNEINCSFIAAVSPHIDLELVREGLAWVVDQQTAVLPDGALALREAEFTAKQNRKGFYKDAIPVVENNEELCMQVIKINKNNMLSCIMNPRSSALLNMDMPVVKVTLSHIELPNAESPHAEILREFLRRRLVGQTVKFTHDSTKRTSPSKKDKTSKKGDTQVQVSIHLSRNNPHLRLIDLTTYDRVADELGSDKNTIDVATWIVAEGLAKVVFAKSPCGQQFMYYDHLLRAAVHCQREGRGIYSNSIPRVAASMTLSSSAKSLESMRFLGLQRRRSDSMPLLHGVILKVEKKCVFKVFLPQENYTLNIMLAGIYTIPQLYATPAKFAQLSWDQRDVSISLDGCNKLGRFAGNIYLPGGENIGTTLIREGFAIVRGHLGQKERVDLQNEAIEKKVGAWSQLKLSDVVVTDDDISEEDEEVETFMLDQHVRVTALDRNQLTVQNEEQVNASSSLSEKMSAYCKSDQQKKVPEIWKGRVLGVRSTSGFWYRGRALRVLDRDVAIQWIDYGGDAMVIQSDCKAIPEDFISPAPMLTTCLLADVELLPSCLDDILKLFNANNQYRMSMAYVYDGKPHYKLTRVSDGVDMSREILRKGWGTIRSDLSEDSSTESLDLSKFGSEQENCGMVAFRRYDSFNMLDCIGERQNTIHGTAPLIN